MSLDEPDGLQSSKSIKILPISFGFMPSMYMPTTSASQRVLEYVVFKLNKTEKFLIHCLLHFLRKYGIFFSRGNIEVTEETSIPYWREGKGIHTKSFQKNQEENGTTFRTKVLGQSRQLIGKFFNIY